jgi:hypothetical protein
MNSQQSKFKERSLPMLAVEAVGFGVDEARRICLGVRGAPKHFRSRNLFVFITNS